MARVESKVTSCDPLVALNELCRAFGARFGRKPLEAEAKILWAGSSHETAKFKRLPNNGVAGVKPGAGWTGDVAVHRTHEIEGGVSTPVDAEFRAYASVYDGFYDWLDLLKRGYPFALDGAAVGDVTAYVTGLQHGWGHNAHYFTADPSAYLAGVWRNLRELNTDYVVAWADITSNPGPGPEGSNES